MRRTSKSWQDYQPKGALESAEEAPAPVVEVEIAAASPTAADAGSSKPGGPAVAAAEATAATKASNQSREAAAASPPASLGDEEAAEPTDGSRRRRFDQLIQRRGGWCPQCRFLDMFPPALVFAEEIFAHVFYPFSLVIMIPLRGWPWAKNKMFIPGTLCGLSKALSLSLSLSLHRRRKSTLILFAAATAPPPRICY